MNKSLLILGSAALIAFACDADPVTDNTGGVGSEGGAGGAGGGNGSENCADGVAVVLSDYISTQIALSTLEGETQSESFISTGSSKTDGLSFALSGDVGLPSSRTSSGKVVLIDRFGTNVITWVAPATAKVEAQLPVGTGFESNPNDYLEIGAGRAFVTRYEDNAAPGEEDFDTGGDVLIIDTQTPEIVGAIELPRSAELDPGGAKADAPLPPRPVGMTRVGDLVLVPLERLSSDWTTMGEAVLAGISIAKEEVVFVQPLSGLKACGRAALSPDGKKLAIACTGLISFTGEVEDETQSALVLLDATTNPPEELARFAATELAGGPIQNDVVFASDDRVLLKTQTALGGPDNNRWLAVALEDGTVTTLLEAGPGDKGGKGLVYGGMSCSPGCSNVCLLADSDRRELARVSVDADGEITLIDSLKVETKVGLPPRDVSQR